MPARSSSPIPTGLGQLAAARPPEPGEHPHLLDCLMTVSDPRRAKGLRHPLAFVLAPAACAVLAGAKSLAAIAEWALDAPAAVLTELGGPSREPTGPTASAEATVRRGLRREEVAQLAAISSTYYTVLKQGRDVRPSRQVLDALATALQLNGTERAHIHELIHGAPPAETHAVVESLPSAGLTLLDRLDPSPSYVTGPRWDVLASNRAARALWTDWPARPAKDRNLLWWMFANPEARGVMVDWPAEASALLGRFRTAAARHPGDPGFSELLELLHSVSPEVRDWWPQHTVTP